MPRRFLRALVGAVLLASLVSPVLAHAELESATPGPGDRVTGSPSELVAQFSQDLDPSRTSLEVRDASGARIARGGELGDGPREFRLVLPSLQPGEYEVRWTSYSTEDNEIARDTYTFEVLESPTPAATRTPSARPSVTPSPTSTATSPPSSPIESLGPGSGMGGTPSGVDGSVLIPIVVALAVAGAFGLWALRRSRA